MKYLCCIERKSDKLKLPHLGLGQGVTKFYFLLENGTSNAAAGVCSLPGDASSSALPSIHEVGNLPPRHSTDLMARG